MGVSVCVSVSHWFVRQLLLVLREAIDLCDDHTYTSGSSSLADQVADLSPPKMANLDSYHRAISPTYQSDGLQLPSVGSFLLLVVSIAKARNKIHNITMFILVDIYEDILEYYVQVRIII